MQYIVHILTFPQHPCVALKNKFVLNQRIMNQLEFYKTVLQKVSFDKTLFRKEYVKALSDLSASDKLKLMWWCNREFPPMVLSPEKEY
jgi:hypothetical protein